MRRPRILGDRSGTAALEFALLGLPFVLLLIGIVEVGRGMLLRIAVDDAADRAQRILMIDPAANAAALQTATRAAFTAGRDDLLALTLATTSVSGLTFREVRLAYPMDLLLPAPLGRTISIGTTRRVVALP